ncbi:MAG: hypothetical protein ABI723_19690 [Bacteroidia bacterium]
MKAINYLGLIDIIIGPFYALIILMIARMHQKRRMETDPSYKYYFPALAVKLIGGVGVCLVYTLYYNGGDTTNFFADAVRFNKILFKDPGGYFYLVTHAVNEMDWSLYDNETGYPIYITDGNSYFVVKFTSLLVFFGCRSYIASTLLIAWISFFGVWKLFRVFSDAFPSLRKELAIAVFFMPSVFFWGSGILKDTITFSTIGYFVSSFNMVLLQRKKIFVNILIMLLSIYVISSIKVYILLGMIPGLLLWIVMGYSEKVSGTMKKALLIPVFLALVFGFGYLLVFSIQGSLGQYSTDKVVYTAVETQRDLKADYYQGNSFDIGEYDPTLIGILQKAPIAIFTCIFRPSIFEANNIVMFISALENTFILFITLRMLIRIRFFGVFKYLLKNSLLTFALVFSFFFAFSVGFSTSNFGSMVRYKIPIIPFFVASVYIIGFYDKQAKESKIEKIEYFIPVGV